MIIDTDPGIDDAMAIFYALAAPDIDLIGLTSIFGNVTTAQATRNALRLLEWGGRADIPVSQGVDRPRSIDPSTPSYNVHGEEGFGDIPAEEPNGIPISEGAPQFLARMAREHQHALTICPIGPLTNIAAAIDADPNFAKNVGRIVIMGGSLDAGGNITEHAEANIYHDPHAAEVVFASGAPITMVGLDVTNQILCSRDTFTDIARAAPNLGGKLKQMSEFYINFYETVGKMGGCALHDPAAVIACTHPHLFTAQNIPITVSCKNETTGATYRAMDGRSTTSVLTQSQSGAVKDQFINTLVTLN